MFAENLLLDETSLLKISDFGLSALYTGAADDTSRATVCATPAFVCCRAPVLCHLFLLLSSL